ncbi:MAG: hypothetical protein ABUS56_07430 [Acidobacteriota bacterium]
MSVDVSMRNGCVSGECAEAPLTLRKETRVTTAIFRIAMLVTLCASASIATYAQSTNSVDALIKRVQALEKRVEDLERLRVATGPASQASGGKPTKAPGETLPAASGGAGTTRVQVPFEVVDRAGKPIIRVVDWDDGSGGLYGYNRSGKIILHVGPMPGGAPGGRVGVWNGNGNPAGGSSLLAEPDGGALVLGRGNTSSHGAFFDGATGELDIFNSGGFAAVALRAGVTGAGRLTLGNTAGDTVVEAGSTVDGIGIVRVGPRANCPSGGLALPCRIVGRK